MFLWSLSWRFTDLLLFLKGPLVFCILYPFFSTYAAQAGHCPRPLWGDWLGNRHQWPACVSICSNNVSSLSDTKLIVASGQMFENSWFSAPYKKSGLRMFVSWSIWLMSPDLTEQLLTASRNVCSTDHQAIVPGWLLIPSYYPACSCLGCSKVSRACSTCSLRNKSYRTRRVKYGEPANKLQYLSDQKDFFKLNVL